MERFKNDLTDALSEIAKAGPTPTLVRGMMGAIRRLLERSATKANYSTAMLFANWSLHSKLTGPDTITEILQGINDVVVPAVQGNYSGKLVPAISEKLKTAEFKTELLHICNSFGIPVDQICTNSVWENSRNQILANLCGVPVSLSTTRQEFKTMAARYPSAQHIVSTISITDDSGSPIMRDHP